MNPNPFASLNHFTVPLGIEHSSAPDQRRSPALDLSRAGPAGQCRRRPETRGRQPTHRGLATCSLTRTCEAGWGECDPPWCRKSALLNRPASGLLALSFAVPRRDGSRWAEGLAFLSALQAGRTAPGAEGRQPCRHAAARPAYRGGLAYTPCGDLCIRLESDRANCGACGNRCGDDEICDHGHRARCGAGYHREGDACVPNGTSCGDTDNDRNNCGGCGHRCSDEEICEKGHRVYCGAGYHREGNRCVANGGGCGDTANDRNDR